MTLAATECKLGAIWLGRAGQISAGVKKQGGLPRLVPVAQARQRGPSAEPARPITLALVISTIIGVFFGLYPASKAARLDPIRALQFE